MFRRKLGPDLIGAGNRFADKEQAQRKNLQPFPTHHSPDCDATRVEMAVDSSARTPVVVDTDVVVEDDNDTLLQSTLRARAGRARAPSVTSKGLREDSATAAPEGSTICGATAASPHAWLAWQCQLGIQVAREGTKPETS